MPAMAAAPPITRCSRGPGPADPDRAGDVVAETAPARPPARRALAFPAASDDLPGERQRVPRVAGHAEPDRRPRGPARAAGPVGDVPLHQARGGEDVEEDVLAAARHGQVPVVVHVLEVPGGERGGDHERRRDLDHAAPAARSRWLGHAGPLPPRGQRQLVVDPWNSARTGMPMRTWSGSAPISSPTIRTPSVQPTSATTNGSVPARHRRVVVHHVAVHLAGPGGHDVVRAARAPQRRAHRARRVAQRAAVVAALDAQLAGGGAGPEELGVPRRPPGAAPRPPPPHAGPGGTRGPDGRNFSTRNSIAATASLPRTRCSAW